jgi:hypothetical protein
MMAETWLRAMDGAAYLVDTGLRVRAVGGGDWQRMAASAGLPALADGSAVIGMPLLDFVAGEDVRDAYRSYIDLLGRNPELTIAFAFRCDAPTLRRDMRMAIRAVVEEERVSGYLFQSTMLEERSRPALNLFAFGAEAPSTSALPLVKVCSYCQRVHAADAELWLEADRYYREGGAEEVRVSHGLCPDCYETKVKPHFDQVL